jgi:hypothetical protein
VPQEPLAAAINELFLDAKRRADRFRVNHAGYWRMYNGDHWPTAMPRWKANLVTNFCFSTVETIKPLLTDNRPEIAVVGRNGTEDDVRKAKIGGACLDYQWDLSDMDLKLPLIDLHALVTGTAFTWTEWDGWSGGGIGNLRVTIPDPSRVHPDPMATDTTDGRYYIVEDLAALSLLATTYERGNLVMPDVGDDEIEKVLEEQMGLGGISVLGDPGKIADMGADATYVRKILQDQSKKWGVARVLKCWMRDDRTFFSERLGLHLPKYPNGRLITVANGIVLRDVPYWGSRCPLVRYVNYDLPGRFWGTGEIKNIQSLNREYNKRVSQIIDIANKTAAPQRLVDDAIDASDDAFTQEPGLIFRIKGADGRPLRSYIDELQPPSIPLYVLKMPEITRRDIEIVSGVPDVAQGRAPSRIEAGKAIEALQTEMKRRIGQKARNIETGCRHQGEVFLSGIIAFWNTPRVVRLTEEVIEGTFGGENGLLKDFQYDVKVKAGSGLPVDKSMAIAEAKGLYMMGLYDEEAVLDVVEPPNKDRIVRTMKPIWEAKRAQILQPPPPPPPKGGPGAPPFLPPEGGGTV